MSHVEVTAEVLRALQVIVDEWRASGVDGVSDHAVRKGDTFHSVDDIGEWGPFVGCPITETPGAWLVAWDPEYDNDELIDNWDSKAAWKEAQQGEDDDESGRVVLIVGCFVDARGKRKPVEVLTVEQANSIKKSVK